MCGIFAYIGSQSQAGTITFSALQDLEYRGYDSWGVGLLTPTGFHLVKQVGRLPQTPPQLPSSQLAFGHTRWATHGQVTQTNAHPHLDCSQKIAVVHNGIVENYDSLRQTLIQQGHHFLSDTDTEVIAHLIESYLDQHSFVEAVRQTARQLTGLNSFLAISVSTGEIVAFRSGSPLVFGRQPQAFLLSSDIPTLIKFTSAIYPLKDGEGIYLTRRQAHLFQLHSSQTTKPKTHTVSFSVEDNSKQQFPHHLIKEIHDIPQVIQRLINLPPSQFMPLKNLITSSRRLFLVAAGTAHHANLLGSYLLAQVGLPALALPASEFRHFSSTLSSSDLVLAASQSGETIDTLEAIRLAKSQGAKTAALVNVPASTLSQEVDFTFYLQAGREQAVLSTKAYLAKLTTFYLLTAALKDQLKSRQHQLQHQLLPALDSFFTSTYRRSLRRLARQLNSHHHLYLLGRGLNYPTALEGALKIKEASYLHAEGFAAGELKHGVIALIESQTPVLAIIAADETQSDILSNAMEVKARGAYLIGLSPQPHSIFDFHLPVPDLPLFSPLINIIPLQLLAYELTLLRGFDPDKPRNLAKSVTVK